MNQDLMNQLQQIATGKMTSSNDSYENTNETKAVDLKTKLNDTIKSLKEMYPTNPNKVFESFKQATVDLPLPTDNFKEYYWDKYLEMYPSGKEDAKIELIKQTENELSKLNSPSEKEFYLRDKLSRFPKWLTSEFKDDVQNLSFRNSYSNLNKSKQLYKDDLATRLDSMNKHELDPDVGEEAHVNDLLKLEKMNLTGVANSFNGRFGVADNKGNFNLASDLQDRKQVFPNDPANSPSQAEQLMVDELAPEFIRKYVKGNLSNQRTKINLDNQASEGVAGMMLEQGKFTLDKWGDAFSMFAKPNYQTLMELGIKGEINSGRVKSDEDLVKTVYMAMNKYKDLLGETPDATNA
jgi:hypothetical protein